jgi:hypothetical protein
VKERYFGEYLGTIVTADGKIDEEINHGLQKAKQIFYQLANTIVGNKELNEDTEMRVYKTVFVPTLLYGTESLTILDKRKNRMQASEMKFLRKVIGKTIRNQIRKTTIRNQLKQESIEVLMEKRRLRWHGHAVRMDLERRPKLVLEARREGGRGRGRPRLEWEEYVEGLARKRGRKLSEVKGLTQNRKEYRKWLLLEPDA